MSEAIFYSLCMLPWHVQGKCYHYLRNREVRAGLKCDILTTASTKITFFFDVTPCSLVDKYQGIAIPAMWMKKLLF
jgi:hypothetical protein